MLVKYGAQERALAAQRSRQVRLFRRFETLTTYLKEISIVRFEVDAYSGSSWAVILNDRGR